MKLRGKNWPVRVAFAGLLITLVVSGASLAQPAAAASFVPGNIISDTDFIDYTSLSLDGVQQFLDRQPGTLSGYTTTAFGVEKRAAQIIYDAAVYYRISPKVILVTLQKEQSLLTDPDPTSDQYDWATGYGVCDSCSKDDPRLQQFRGFFNQVNWTARRFRQYIDTAGAWHFIVGGTYIIDGQTVIIENQATVNLYTYTPHLHGNQNFWRLWNQWFAKTYPDGTVLRQEGSGGVWLIQDGVKRPFWSRAAFVSRYSPNQVIVVSRNELDAYGTGKPIKFAEYSLLQTPEGTRYLLSGDQKRLIESDEVFRNIGFNPEEVIAVAADELAGYADGDPVGPTSVYPNGVLLQSKTTGGIVFVQNGIRHSLWSKEVLTSRFPNRKPLLVTDEEIEQYPRAEDVAFKDGDLITSPGSSAVFFISDGTKRPFASREAFEGLGYRWENIVRTSDRALEVHPLGEPITL